MDANELRENEARPEVGMSRHTRGPLDTKPMILDARLRRCLFGLAVIGAASRCPLMSHGIAVVVAACLALSAPSMAAHPEAMETASATRNAPTGSAVVPDIPSTAPDATATPPKPKAPSAALFRLQPGQWLRVAASDSKTVEGRLAAIRDGRLVLDGPPGSAPIETIQTVWIRGRDTKRGALAFGTLGGLTGGALVGLFRWAMCDVESCRDDWPTGAVIGMVSGGALGAATGYLLGSASPRWNRVYSAGPAGEGGALAVSFAPMGPAGPMRDRIGSASLYLGYNKALDAIAPSGAPGGRLSLTVERGLINPSLEIGRYGLGSRDVVTVRGEPIHYDESLFHIGPAVSVGPVRGTIQPYALASVGFYRWKAFVPIPYWKNCIDCIDETEHHIHDTYVPTSHHNFLGGSLGAGVRVHIADPLSLGVEGRWHTNLTSGPWMSFEEPSRRLSLLTLTGGATLGW